MIRGDCVSNHHQKSLDGNFVSTANVWDKPCDSEGSEGSSNIHIKVKFMSRKESSVDTNYEDYLNQFIEEEYRSEIESIDEIGVDRAKLEGCCSRSISISQHPTSNSQLISQTGYELNCNMQDVEHNQESPVTKFWHGYGGNIYFQPMTCKAVPRKIMKSVEKSQKLRPSKRSNFTVKNQATPVDLCVDASSSKSTLDNTGTLRFVDNRRLGRRFFKDIMKYRVDGARVGNFIMSEDLKLRLCKGFVCRTTDKFASSSQARTFQDFPSSENPIYVKAAMTPTDFGNQEPCFGKVKRANNTLEKKNTMPESLESHDFFSLFPRMISQPHYTDKMPRKKEIAGKLFHLTNNSQTIKKINLFPFIHPLVSKGKTVRKSHSASKLLHCSTDVNADTSIRHLEEKVVADHLQDIGKLGHFKFSSFRDPSSEEQYTCESLFSYHNKKVSYSVTKTGSLKTALVTKSLSSSHQKSRERPSEDPSNTQHLKDSLEPVGDGKTPDEKKLESVNKQGVEHCAIYVNGKELNSPGKPSVLNNVQGYRRISPEGKHTGIESKRIFSLVDEDIIIGHNQDISVLTNAEVELLSSSVDLTQRDAKAVHFEEDDGGVWSIDFTSYEPLAAKATLTVDRYKIPASKPCRLPVIGQKMPSKSI